MKEGGGEIEEKEKPSIAHFFLIFRLQKHIHAREVNLGGRKGKERGERKQKRVADIGI